MKSQKIRHCCNMSKIQLKIRGKKRKNRDPPTHRGLVKNVGRDGTPGLQFFDSHWKKHNLPFCSGYNCTTRLLVQIYKRGLDCGPLSSFLSYILQVYCRCKPIIINNRLIG